MLNFRCHMLPNGRRREPRLLCKLSARSAHSSDSFIIAVAVTGLCTLFPVAEIITDLFSELLNFAEHLQHNRNVKQ